jgi:hypothetical protein
MAELLLHNKPVATVFDLLGQKENDMTFALAWGMAHSDSFLTDVVSAVAGNSIKPADIQINLQRHDDLGGFTDIEITARGGLRLIVEAKRGWELPTRVQLDRYAERFKGSSPDDCWMVVLTQWGAREVVRHKLAELDIPYRVAVLSWGRMLELANRHSRSGPLAERRLLRELATYFREVADMRDIDSNQAYCVSLSGETLEGATVTWIDVVRVHRTYFYSAVRGGWPKTPPNYMAFRYQGRLQAIHHVDSYEIATGWPKALSLPPRQEEPWFFLSLGPPIVPPQEVRNGPSVLRSARVWVDMDLLLTSKTITEALKATKARRAS